jgi:RHS repeat-associated protein
LQEAQNTSTASPGNTIYGYSLTFSPNSNVATDAETGYDPGVGDESWSWIYNYDTLNRLVSATSSGAIQFGCAETYDAFGNRTNQAPYGGTGYSCTSASTAVTPGTNQLSGYSYDNAGDLLYDGSNTLTYDAEGHISTSTSSNGGTTSYTYDGEGVRISKTIGGVETDFVRDLDGTLLDTWLNGTYMSEPQEVWIDGRHYGFVYVYLDPDSGTPSQEQGTALTNWLGTETIRSYSTGATGGSTGIPTYIFASQPFGDARTNLVGSGSYDSIYFTGKERDTESENDYFGARYYGSSMGRFMTPDPLGPWVADASDPQSWNMYAYARNNPLINVDPAGLDCVYFNDAGNGVESVDRNSNSGECGQNGGDWINGTVRSAQYFSDSDTWSFRSNDDSGSNYTTFAGAPGPQANGVPCYGNCDKGYIGPAGPLNDDTLNPYATAVIAQVGLQTGPTYVMASRAFCSAVTFGQAGGFTAGVAGMPIPKSWITSVPHSGGAGVSGVTSLSSAASSAAFRGGDPVITGAAGQLLKSISTSPGSFAGTARVGGAIGRVANKVASSEAAGVFAALGLACIGGHP